MACGCNKRTQRRSQVIKVSGPKPQGGSTIKLNDAKTLNMQSNKVGGQRKENLNQGGMDAEKRRIQAIRRNEILKKLGKR